jgi:hypothetical protein
MLAPQISRSHEWWEPKITLVIAMGLLSIRANVNDDFVSALIMLGKLCGYTIVGAIYVSLINDFTDITDDVKAGKKNRLRKFSKFNRIAFICLSLIGVGIFSYNFRPYPNTLTLLIAAVFVYSMYSFPPIRLKSRGIWGVLADALGAHVFPATAAFVGIVEFSGKPIAPEIVALIGLWSLIYGIRGILGHQYMDVEHDRLSSTKTFATKYPVEKIRKIERWWVFSEIVLFSMILFLLNFDELIFILLFYITIVGFLKIRKKVNFTLIIHPPKVDYNIFLSGYYQVFLVISVLVSLSLKFGHLYFVLIPIFIIIFPNKLLMMAKILRFNFFLK